MSGKIKDLPYGSQIRTFMSEIFKIAKTSPIKIPYILEELRNKLVELDKKDVGPSILLSKGEYVLVIGTLNIRKEEISSICKEFAIKDVRFFDDYDKMSGIEDVISSSRCVAVICGPVPHSLPNEVISKYDEKIFKARVSGKLKITRGSFLETIEKMMLDRTKKHLEYEQSRS